MDVWKQYIKGFKAYILMERTYSQNTFVSYLFDLQKFFDFMNTNHRDITPQSTTTAHIRDFVNHINTKVDGDADSRILKASSQNRLLSSLRAFFKYLLIENEIEDDPTALVGQAKLPSKLPEVLTNDEIMLMINACDKSTYHGFRNYLLIEVLYATGLRISELINLKISDVFFREEFIRVVGKGNKERIVPIGKIALRQLKIFIRNWRTTINIPPKNEQYIFLNRRGNKMTRQYAFMVLKDLALRAGITKNVHPHTLRHSFATEMVMRGANIMTVKDMMGHTSVSSTEIYTNFDTSTLRETLMLFHPLYNNKHKMKI
ncbi:MAG: tyrosine recombinase [Bacteroidales bacterium]|jgi:integrase/recombinase XerD|nr:tyrosine recombinase [Bacteroidales bacterium]